MFQIAGIVALLIAFAAIIVLATLTALQLRRLVAHAAGLRSHPILDSEWLERKAALALSLGDNAQHLRDSFSRLSVALDAIAGGLGELTVTVYASAAGVEEIMDATAPWLRGLFAPRRNSL